MSVVISGNRVFITVISGRLSPLKVGTLLADGTEQTLLEFMDVGRVVGYVDLGNMQAGDTIIMRQYMKIVAGGAYKQYYEATYSDVPSEPLLYILPKEVDVALKVTLQQTAGINRSFPYNFMREF